jgi:hypothetical protein
MAALKEVCPHFPINREKRDDALCIDHDGFGAYVRAPACHGITDLSKLKLEERLGDQGQQNRHDGKASIFLSPPSVADCATKKAWQDWGIVVTV